MKMKKKIYNIIMFFSSFAYVNRFSLFRMWDFLGMLLKTAVQKEVLKCWFKNKYFLVKSQFPNFKYNKLLLGGINSR